MPPHVVRDWRGRVDEVFSRRIQEEQHIHLLAGPAQVLRHLECDDGSGGLAAKQIRSACVHLAHLPQVMCSDVLDPCVRGGVTVLTKMLQAVQGLVWTEI